MKDKTSLGPFLPEMYEKPANKTFVRQCYSSVGRQLRKDNSVKLQIGVLKRVELGTTTRSSKCVVWPGPQWDLREEHACNMPHLCSWELGLALHCSLQSPSTIVMLLAMGYLKTLVDKTSLWENVLREGWGATALPAPKILPPPPSP